MTGDSISVRGGVAGTAVVLDSMDAAAHLIAVVAREVADVACRVAAVPADPDLVAGSVLSPRTGARTVASVAEVIGPRGLSGDLTSLVALASAVAAASQSYRRAEALAAGAVAAAQDTVMLVVGGLAPEVLVGVLTLDALGVDVAEVLDRVAFDEPAIADLAGGAEGLVVGLRSNPLTAPLVSAPPRPDGLGSEEDYEAAVRQLADSAAVWGLLSDRGRAQVTAEVRPRSGSRVPRSLEDLATDQLTVGDGAGYAGHIRVIEVPQPAGSAWIVEISGTQVWDPRAGRNPFDVTTDVRAMAQDATVLADGVQQALAQAQAASASAASLRPASASAASLRPASASAASFGSPGPASAQPAGVAGSSEPVMLVGHSLGGIAAAGLASSAEFTRAHRVTHVVTLGSPVGRMPIPTDVEVLSLEHTQDAVPRLDGVANPDRATWVTVARELDGAGVDRASQAHDGRLYADTAAIVDGSSDPSVTTWRAGSAAFFAGDAHGQPVVRDYSIERVAP